MIYVLINTLMLWYEWQSDIMLNEKQSPKRGNPTWSLSPKVCRTKQCIDYGHKYMCQTTRVKSKKTTNAKFRIESLQDYWEIERYDRAEAFTQI